MLNTVVRSEGNSEVYVVDLAPGAPTSGPIIAVNSSKTATLNRVHSVSYIGSASVTLTVPDGSAVGDRIAIFIEKIGVAPSTFSVAHGTSTLMNFGAPMFSQQYIRLEWSGSAWILI